MVLQYLSRGGKFEKKEVDFSDFCNLPNNRRIDNVCDNKKQQKRKNSGK